MPHVSDKVVVQPGGWVNPHRRRTRFSNSVCPVCGFWLHQILHEHGVKVHPLCDPRPWPAERTR